MSQTSEWADSSARLKSRSKREWEQFRPELVSRHSLRPCDQRTIPSRDCVASQQGSSGAASTKQRASLSFTQIQAIRASAHTADRRKYDSQRERSVMSVFCAFAAQNGNQ